MPGAAVRVRRGLVVVALAARVLLAREPPQVPEYELKAEFLERFTRFIDWPNEAGPETPFVIGVLAPNPFGRYLDELASSRKVKGRPIVVKEIAAPENADECDLLFVPASHKKNLPRILSKTSGKPILTVGDTDGFAEKGILVNFYTSESNLRFEINDAAIKKSGLKASSKLLKLARIIGLEESR